MLLFFPFVVLALILFYYLARTILIEDDFFRNFFILGVASFSLVIVFEVIGGFLDGDIDYVLMMMKESFKIFGQHFFWEKFKIIRT